MTVIDVVLFGNSIQAVDALVPALEPFFQMRAGSHELIAGPMKFDAGFPQPFLKVDPSTSLSGSLSPGSPCPRAGFPLSGLCLLLSHAESYSNRRRDFLPCAQSSHPERGLSRCRAKGPLPLPLPSPLPLPLPFTPLAANCSSRVFRLSRSFSKR